MLELSDMLLLRCYRVDNLHQTLAAVLALHASFPEKALQIPRLIDAW